MAIRPVNKLRRTESLGAASMATLKSESDTTDDDYTIEGGNNYGELDYKVIEFEKFMGINNYRSFCGIKMAFFSFHR